MPRSARAARSCAAVIMVAPELPNRNAWVSFSGDVLSFQACNIMFDTSFLQCWVTLARDSLKGWTVPAQKNVPLIAAAQARWIDYKRRKKGGEVVRCR